MWLHKRNLRGRPVTVYSLDIHVSFHMFHLVLLFVKFYSGVGLHIWIIHSDYVLTERC
jgi:hypothetical protein